MRPLALTVVRLHLGRHGDGVLDFEGVCGGGAELLGRRKVMAFTWRLL